MKCRICGAKLRKEGDICKSCYEEYCEEEELEKDVNEIYKIHRKYLPSYQLTQYLDWYVATIIVFLAMLAQSLTGFAILFLIFAIITLIFVLIWEKKKAINTTCTFYEKKIVWKYKDKKKTMAYSDLNNISYYQNFFQKVFNLADIQFRPENGTYLINGFEIKNIANFDKTWEEIKEIINSKKEN